MENQEILEKFCGITRYASKDKGIGGIIKTLPEDFLVEEISDFPESRGEHLIIIIKKKNWDTVSLISEIARKLNIDTKLFGFAGNKDRNAITIQKISIQGINKSDIENLSIKDMEILSSYYTTKKIRIGNLKGNRFRITIRDISLPEKTVRDRIDNILQELNGYFPNFFTLQRFGKINPNNHIIGKYLLQKKYDIALNHILTDFTNYENPETISAKIRFSEEGDYYKALHYFPPYLKLEKQLIRNIIKYKKPEIAFKKLQKPLIKLFFHAYQSYIYNTILSERISENSEYYLPANGDYVIFGWKSIEVDNSNILSIRKKITQGICSCALPLIGYNTKKDILDRYPTIATILEKDNISLSDFKNRFVKIKHGFRKIAEKIDNFSYRIEKDIFFNNSISVVVSFTLNKGSYATALLREIQKNTAPV